MMWHSPVKWKNSPASLQAASNKPRCGLMRARIREIRFVLKSIILRQSMRVGRASCHRDRVGERTQQNQLRPPGHLMSSLPRRIDPPHRPRRSTQSPMILHGGPITELYGHTSVNIQPPLATISAPCLLVVRFWTNAHQF